MGNKKKRIFTITNLRNLIIECVDREIDRRLEDVKEYPEENFVFHELHNEIETLRIFSHVTRRILLENIEDSKLLGLMR